jgi:exodeoxyribonuclease V beta subunit
VTNFDVCGALPTGTTLLEASAGTGKTFTIAALATRLVAEGYADLSQLMLVTFGRLATAELRERVRGQLLSAYRALGDPPTARADDDDSVEHLLATGTDAEIAERRHRLRGALSAFDAATIATTHSFCEQMLASLGTAGDKDPSDSLIERVEDLVDEVVTDWWVQRFSPMGTAAPFTTFGGCARPIAKGAVGDRHAALWPPDAPAGTEAQLRYDLARDVRDEVQRRKRARHLIDYDDMLIRLRDALIHPVTGPIACDRLRNRFRYVLVDEFQDTDPVQWEILRTAFHGHSTLILIGDPKQAIYAFRGADVYAYLDAAKAADDRFALGRNWRSDEALLDALHAVYGGLALGDPEIVAERVEAQHQTRRLAGAPSDVPLRLRVVPRAALQKPNQRVPTVGVVRDYISGDVAADIVALLNSDATLTLDGAPRRVMPQDIAVLVGKHRDAATVQEALRDAGVSAVVTGMRSVFASSAAREWLTFLRALEQPHRSGLVRAAVLTSFVGWTAVELATAPDPAVDDIGQRMRDWRDLLATRGIAALFEVVSGAQRLTERVLARDRGERDLTDLRHVAQALHAAMQTEGLGSTALVEWLERRITDAEAEVTEERSRRLETDAEAVQILTIHTCKGLEFPIVYVPFAWDEWPMTSETLQYHGPDGIRRLFVGGQNAPGYQDARQKSVAEEHGENLRLLYVALTRAKCQVVAWWAGTNNTKTAPLHRLLFGPRVAGQEVPISVDVKLDVDAKQILNAWAATASDCVAIEEAPPPGTPIASYTAPTVGVATLDAATLHHLPDFRWRRTSYSDLTERAHEAMPGVTSEPEDDERRDEPALPLPENAAGDDALRDVLSPMGELSGGTTFGNIVHSILETVDTTTGDLAGELERRTAQELARRLSTVDATVLADALHTAMQTPLGPLADSRTLADFTTRDRLAELDFELPLLGGDEPHDQRNSLKAVAASLRTHLPDGDPLVKYPDLIDNSGLRDESLRGYLGGSIDAVLRVNGPRYLVVDYKTNYLGMRDEPLTAWHYRPSALAEAMLHAHYPLQALLYSVALHRFLRWRQPSYDPTVHLGGVLYLFVRGMCGPATPVVDGVPTGVFSWRPPAALITDLSDLLDRGGA